MTREHIVAEIRRTAAENAGFPLGQMRFSTETGIRKSDWYGHYWVRWGDALVEAGFQPNLFTSALPEDALLSKLAALVRELGHFPVEGELRLKARSDPTFPDHSTLRKRLGTTKARVAKLRAFCLQNGMDAVAALCPIGRDDDREATDAGKPHGVDAGHVYLMRSGRFYKIGRTNSVGRRERELAIQVPEKVRLVHSIKTDDPAGIEDYWHKRFQERRKNGEWFELTADDVAAFRRRRFQ